MQRPSQVAWGESAAPTALGITLRRYQPFRAGLTFSHRPAGPWLNRDSCRVIFLSTCRRQVCAPSDTDGVRGFHSRSVARIPGLKSETWGTLRFVTGRVVGVRRNCRSLGFARDDKGEGDPSMEIGCSDPGSQSETWGTLRFVTGRVVGVRKELQIPRLRSG
jgi:hypothetical protein